MKFIDISTFVLGLINGGFNGANTSYCNLALISFEEDI